MANEDNKNKKPDKDLSEFSESESRRLEIISNLKFAKEADDKKEKEKKP